VEVHSGVGLVNNKSHTPAENYVRPLLDRWLGEALQLSGRKFASKLSVTLVIETKNFGSL
jgi:hypothetical protein